MRLRGRAWALVGAGGLVACAALSPLPPAPPLDPVLITRDVAWLADDAREGRGPGSRGLDQAARYLARGFAGSGFRPASGEGDLLAGFEMPISIRVAKASLALGAEPFERRSDFEPFLSSDDAEATSEVVFAGYGISAPNLDYDDYAGSDVRGRAVLILTDRPGGEDGPLQGAHAHGFLRRAYKIANARERGATTVLLAPSLESAEGLPADAGAGWANPTTRSSGVAVVAISREAAERIVAAAGGASLDERQRAIDSSGHPAPELLAGVRVSVSVAIERRRGRAANVVGVRRGSDPELAHEAVVVGAHYDHLGHGEWGSMTPDRRGEVHNGADDNASGAAGLLALARAFGSSPPTRRTLVLAAFAGEEMGLLGSQAYVEDPAVPLEDTIAMVNLDMIGRLRERQLTVFGAETSPAFPSLVRQAVAGLPLELQLARGGFAPSDQMTFYARGVPVLLFFTGVHPEYHTPDDDPKNVDALGAGVVLAAVYRATHALLDADERPVVVVSEEPSPHAGNGEGGGYGPYLGTIPDFAGSSEPGVLLQGVRPGSPAEAAGLRAGDRIVGFSGTGVANLEEYAALLFASEPGREVEITVLRGGERLTLRATLGQRR